jgi:hypothetical protein
MNGNKLKGNNQKKGVRGKKEVYAVFDENTDKYAKIIARQGGKHVSVIILGDQKKTPVQVMIRGIHHKKVYMMVNDIVIIRGTEVWGKVPDSDANRIKREFNKREGSEDTGNIIFQNENEINSDDEDENPKSRTKSRTTPNITTDNSNKNEEEEFNFDDI